MDTPGSAVQHVPGTQDVIVDFGTQHFLVSRAVLQTGDERVQKLAALGLEPNQVRGWAHGWEKGGRGCFCEGLSEV